MDASSEQILAGTLEIPLAECELRQCGEENAVAYTGPGLLDQDNDKKIRLRMFSPGVDVAEAFRRDFSSPVEPGQLMPDSAYYDFFGTDIDGATWTASHLSPDFSFGAGDGTYIRAVPWQVEKIETVVVRSVSSVAVALLPTTVELPWNRYSDTPGGGKVLDLYEQKEGELQWSVRKSGHGMLLRFATKSGAFELVLTKFLHGLSILAGRALTPAVLTIATDGKRTMRIYNRQTEFDDACLLAPIRLRPLECDDANRFLERYLAANGACFGSDEDYCSQIYALWHRVLRARVNDIENSSLVLSVAIESLIKAAFSTEMDIDPEFMEQVELARPVIKAAKLKERARSCILSSLGNALRPRPQDVLIRLIDQGFIATRHLECWKSLRHAAAHGAALEGTTRTLQQHLDRFHTCLNLFYRLMFAVVGYRGGHWDFSSPGWPVRAFPPDAGGS